MKLIVYKIIIEKNGKIIGNYDFNRTITMVQASAELYDAIRAILGIYEPICSFHNIKFLAVVRLDKVYYIRGTKNKGDSEFEISVHKENDEADFTKEYFDAIEQNKEHDSTLLFHLFKRQNYPHKLFKYRDLLKYYPGGTFDELTNGYGSTRSFRGFVANYIKHFKPIRLLEDKNLFLQISKDGDFWVGYLDGQEKVKLNENEELLYHYLSFLSIADFWDRAEKIRNLNRVNKPLVVSNFAKCLEKGEHFFERVTRKIKIRRQIILFADECCSEDAI